MSDVYGGHGRDETIRYQIASRSISSIASKLMSRGWLSVQGTFIAWLRKRRGLVLACH